MHVRRLSVSCRRLETGALGLHESAMALSTLWSKDYMINVSTHSLLPKCLEEYCLLHTGMDTTVVVLLRSARASRSDE